VVYFGKRGGETQDFFSRAPDFEVVGSEGYLNLGHTLRAVDVNGDNVDDLVMSAPYASSASAKDRGAVYVFVSGAPRNSAQPRRVTEREADFRLDSVAPFEHFGLDVGVGTTPRSGTQHLLVGAPHFRRDGGTASFGSLYIFDLPLSKAVTSSFEARLAIEGDQINAKFGGSFSVASSGVLAVSSPSYSTAGTPGNPIP
jgi:hypothetical protein